MNCAHEVQHAYSLHGPLKQSAFTRRESTFLSNKHLIYLSLNNKFKHDFLFSIGILEARFFFKSELNWTPARRHFARTMRQGIEPLWNATAAAYNNEPTGEAMTCFLCALFLDGRSPVEVTAAGCTTITAREPHSRHASTRIQGKLMQKKMERTKHTKRIIST